VRSANTRYFGQAACPLPATSQEHEKLSGTDPIYAQDAKVAEIPPGAILKSELELLGSAAVEPEDFLSCFQLQSLDKDAIVNISIITITIVIVAIQVFSINTGITRGWSPDEVAYRIPIDTWRSYNDILNMAPIQTKAVTSATVYTIGDIIAQTTEGVEVGQLDRGRICRSLAAGLIGHGPLSHV